MGVDIGTLFQAIPAPLTSTTTWTSVISITGTNWGIPSYDTCITCSSDGKYVLALGNGAIKIVYLSSNGGSSWMRIDNAGTGLNTGIAYAAVAISDSGQYMYAGNNSNNILKSSNYGNSWGVIFNGVGSGIVSCDGTGAYILINANTASPAGGVKYSTNYGSTFSAIKTFTSVVLSTHISNNGLYWVVGQLNGNIHLSTNNGTSWSLIYTGTTLNNNVKVTNTGIVYRTTSTKTYKYSGGSWTALSPATTSSYVCSINKDGLIILLSSSTSSASVNGGSTFSSTTDNALYGCVSSSGNCMYKCSTTNIYKCIG